MPPAWPKASRPAPSLTMAQLSRNVIRRPLPAPRQARLRDPQSIARPRHARALCAPGPRSARARRPSMRRGWSSVWPTPLGTPIPTTENRASGSSKAPRAPRALPRRHLAWLSRAPDGHENGLHFHKWPGNGRSQLRGNMCGLYFGPKQKRVRALLEPRNDGCGLGTHAITGVWLYLEPTQ